MAPTNNHHRSSSVLPDFEAFVTATVQRETADTGFARRFVEAVDTAVQSPLMLYRFFQLYNILNAGISSNLPCLVGNLAKSRRCFLDRRHGAARDEADYSFKLAGLVQQAATNEFGDPDYLDDAGKPMTHRDLAVGVLTSVGDYAGLTTAQKDALAVPAWLELNVERIQEAYAGRKDQLAVLAAALGVHIFSELSADMVEFSNACKVLFVERKGLGYHAYLQKHPKVSVQGQTFPAHWWLKTHGGYDEEKGVVHAAEYQHLESGYAAALLLYERVPEEMRGAVLEALYEGMALCRSLLDEFFVGVRSECLLLLRDSA